MEFFEDKRAGVVIVGLKRGEDIFQSLEKVAREANVPNGVVMSGIGSLTKAYIHTVDSNDYPPKEQYINLEGPLEVVQFGGIIASYAPHVHISLWDKHHNFYGGHLHEGCEILALSEISILRLPELELARKPDASGIYHLAGA
jgi:hypothetical protein